MDRGVLSYLFAPPEEHSEFEELYQERFPIMRKAATAAVIGFIEMAPALAVYGKAPKANQRIERTPATVQARKDSGRCRYDHLRADKKLSPCSAW